MKLHFQKLGEGPVIVVLHGLFGMSDNWLTIAKKMEFEYCFYLLDLRNHGRSPHSNEFNYQQMGEDVQEFCESHNLTKVNLLGHSMGGKVAISFANNDPGHLEKLIIVDMANKVYTSSIFEKFIEVMVSVDLEKISTRKEAENMFLQKMNVYPAVLQFLLKNLYRDKNNKFNWYLNLHALKENLENILTKVVLDGPIKINTLFMRGSDSDYIKEGDEREIKEQFINSRIITIDGANHWVHSSAQQNFVRALRNFLNE
jgi:pimeloyl-ACP methyl ester carboxylesterase